jgi:hypothetical protein
MPRASKAAIRQSANNALQQAREAAGRELDLPVDDWRVVRLATLTMASDQLQAELALGGRIDFNDLLSVDKQLAELRKELKPAAKPVAVQVTYVHPNTKCPKCSHEFSLDLPDDDSSGSPVQAANNKPLPGDPYVVAKPVDQTPPKAPGSIVAAVPGAAAMSRLAVIDLEEQRADRSAQLRDEALKDNHFALKRNQPSNYSPNIGAPYLGNDKSQRLAVHA